MGLSSSHSCRSALWNISREIFSEELRWAIEMWGRFQERKRAEDHVTVFEVLEIVIQMSNTVVVIRHIVS